MPGKHNPRPGSTPPRRRRSAVPLTVGIGACVLLLLLLAVAWVGAGNHGHRTAALATGSPLAAMPRSGATPASSPPATMPHSGAQPADSAPGQRVPSPATASRQGPASPTPGGPPVPSGPFPGAAGPTRAPSAAVPAPGADVPATGLPVPRTVGPSAGRSARSTPGMRAGSARRPPVPAGSRRPGQPAGALTAGYVLAGTRESSFEAGVHLTNAGTAATGWKVELGYPAAARVTVTGIWNATVTVRGDTLVFEGPALAAGGSHTFGFQATKAVPAPVEPIRCRANGAACGRF